MPLTGFIFQVSLHTVNKKDLKRLCYFLVKHSDFEIYLILCEKFSEFGILHFLHQKTTKLQKVLFFFISAHVF